MKFLSAIILSFVITLSSQAQVTINDVTLAATIKAGDTSIALNGGGIRKKLWFKLYVGGLYLTTKTSDASKIINADEAMGIKLQITSGIISSDNMSEAINEGFEKSAGSTLASLKSKIEKFVGTFSKSEIVEGNVFDIIYLPRTGVQTSKNGKLISTIDGLDFKKALFGIWLCDEPADDDLKEAMLGK